MAWWASPIIWFWQAKKVTKFILHPLWCVPGAKSMIFKGFTVKKCWQAKRSSFQFLHAPLVCARGHRPICTLLLTEGVQIHPNYSRWFSQLYFETDLPGKHLKLDPNFAVTVFFIVKFLFSKSAKHGTSFRFVKINHSWNLTKHFKNIVSRKYKWKSPHKPNSLVNTVVS